MKCLPHKVNVKDTYRRFNDDKFTVYEDFMEWSTHIPQVHYHPQCSVTKLWFCLSIFEMQISTKSSQRALTEQILWWQVHKNDRPRDDGTLWCV